jgi:hypothetical protein
MAISEGLRFASISGKPATRSRSGAIRTAITNATMMDRYHSSGKAIQQVGWKVLDFQTEKRKANNRRAIEFSSTA